MQGYPLWAHWGGIGMGVLILAAIIVAIVFFARARKQSAPEGDAPEAKARGLLAERFARGEIDAEAYRFMRAELASDTIKN
ncbi:MAG: SHOCT domain-containing protein [Spirochaetes bacterium]|nr:SHOCT domain-containing protein [Spirochaetota bacterium]MBU1082386.1 SHOCT domain-containing protein [Spirochaetota bacterium]